MERQTYGQSMCTGQPPPMSAGPAQGQSLRPGRYSTSKCALSVHKTCVASHFDLHLNRGIISCVPGIPKVNGPIGQKGWSYSSHPTERSRALHSEGHTLWHHIKSFCHPGIFLALELFSHHSWMGKVIGLRDSLI